MEINDWRQKIDAVDLELLGLLNMRAQYSVEIARIKKRKRSPVHCPEREKWIIESLLKKNQGPMTGEGVRRIFERIIDESRNLEKLIVCSESVKKRNGG